MEFCDSICCTDSEDCKELGTIAINLVGYHKVCSNHFNLNKEIIKCRICKSFIIITTAETNKYLNPSSTIEDEQDYNSEEIYCPSCKNIHNRDALCIDDNFVQIAKYCYYCKNEIDTNSFDLNHKHCDKCPEYIYCNYCLSNHEINELNQYYLLNCGHLACSHIFESDCKVYSPICSSHYCSKCQNHSYLFNRFSFSVAYGLNQSGGAECWKCISIKNYRDIYKGNEISNYEECKCNYCGSSENLYNIYNKFICTLCYNSQFANENTHINCQNCENQIATCQLGCEHFVCENCSKFDSCRVCESMIPETTDSTVFKCSICGESEFISKCEWGHFGCSRCTPNSCFFKCSNKKCKGCENQIQSTAIFLCGHEACVSCISSQCKICNNNDSIGECSRCNCKKRLCLINNEYFTTDICNHPSCYACIVWGKKCKKCNIETNIEPTPNYEIQNKKEFIDVKEDNISNQIKEQEGYNRNNKIAANTNEDKIKEKSEKKININESNILNHEKPIHRKVASNNPKSDKKAYKSQSSLKSDTKSKIKTDIIEQSKLKKLNSMKQIKEASPVIKNIDDQINKHNCDRTLIQKNNISEEEMKHQQICNKCNKVSDDCQNLICSHKICTDCMTSKTKRFNCPLDCQLKLCNHCRLFKFCIQCKTKNEFICHADSNAKCICSKCKKPGEFILLECGHLYCQKCSKSRGKDCLICLQSKEICSICLFGGFPKKLLSCNHYGCTNCILFENPECLNCVFKNVKNAPKSQGSENNCIKCSKNTKNYYKLLCKHVVCDDCFKFNWKVINFRCYSCVTAKKYSEKCFYCFNNHKVNIKDGLVIKECCKRLFTLDLTEVFIN